jgi:hypothetical protein
VTASDPTNARSSRIVWRRLDVPGVEWCEVASTDDGIAIDGLALVDWDGVAHRIEYRLELDDAARTRRVTVRDRAGSDDVELVLEADGLGTWRRGGEVVVASPDAIDVDLGFSPLTNSLPIWRYDLEVGESRDFDVACVPFPSLAVERGRQTYTRTGPLRWRYASGDFAADLEVGADGLVERYGDHWEAVARG